MSPTTTPAARRRHDGALTPAWHRLGERVRDKALGEDGLDALRRELREEVGLIVAVDPPHVWHQVVIGAGLAPGVDGIVNDYFLLRTTRFEPRGEFTDDELTAEHIGAFRWWRFSEITENTGPEVFSPRDLAALLTDLLASGVPAGPVTLGL